jgi:hypothetical protein
MSTPIGTNGAKQKFAANDLVLCFGVNLFRTKNVAMMAAACGLDALYIDLRRPSGCKADQGGGSRRFCWNSLNHRRNMISVSITS